MSGLDTFDIDKRRNVSNCTVCEGDVGIGDGVVEFDDMTASLLYEKPRPSDIAIATIPQPNIVARIDHFLLL